MQLCYIHPILSVPCFGSDHITSALSVRLSSSYTREQSRVVTNGIDIKYLIKIMCCRKSVFQYQMSSPQKQTTALFFHLTFTSSGFPTLTEL